MTALIIFGFGEVDPFGAPEILRANLLSIQSSQATPLVGKNEYFLSLPPGSVSNIPSWKEMTKSSRNAPRNAESIVRKTLLDNTNHRLVKKSSLEGKSKHPSKPKNTAMTLFLQDLLANQQLFQRRQDAFPLHNCFVRQFSRDELFKCIELEYSMQSGRWETKAQNLMDRIKLKDLEINALRHDVSEMVSHRLRRDQDSLEDAPNSGGDVKGFDYASARTRRSSISVLRELLNEMVA